MDTVKIHNHNQMEQYDFSKPINVTIMFEDADDESLDKNKIYIEDDDDEVTVDSSNKKQKLVKSNLECDGGTDVICIEATIKENIVIIEQNIKSNVNDTTNVVMENSQVTSNITHESETGNPDQNMEPLINQNHITEQNATCDTVREGNKKSTDSQNGNNHEDLNDYIDALLNVVSENLILIMRPFHYYYHRNKEVTEDVVLYLNKLKTHFFDLSYSSVVTLILPQEHNKKFIDNFIDKTVVIANKVMTWKCARNDVEPFYNEMIVWTKKKRENIIRLTLLKPNYRIKTNGCKDQQNRVLKEHLANPPKQIHVAPQKKAVENKAAPKDANAVNPSDPILNTKNKKCILSAGPPGREITINIDSDMLQDYNYQYNNNIQQNHVNEMCRNIDNTTSIYAQNVQQATSEVQYNYNVNHQNTYHQNYTLHYKPPPPYNSNHNHNTSNPYYIKRNYIQKNIAKNIRNCQTQSNINQFAAPAHSHSNIGQMYSTYSKEQNIPISSLTQIVQNISHPVITSCVSLNSRCCICGKTCFDTRTRCSKCNMLVYCGYLCQELDAGSHNSLCGKS